MPISESSKLLTLHPNDNVAVALAPLDASLELAHPNGEANRSIKPTESIRLGHKIALDSIDAGEIVFKYGQPIGEATQTIKPGAWVHTHNLKNLERKLTNSATLTNNPAEASSLSSIPHDHSNPKYRGASFQGYRRQSGRAGTRNYLAVISTVNCSATVAKTIARHFGPDQLAAYPNIDGVVAFTHATGCGMPFQGESHKMLNRVLGGIAKHPNIGGFLIIGLGCEQNTLGVLTGEHGLHSIANSRTKKNEAQASAQPFTMALQDEGGTRKTILRGIELVQAMLPQMNEIERVDIDASELLLGTECGGSDAYSGITANPAVGVCSDLLVSCGGTSVLAETPEIYGAEQLLVARARTAEVADRLLEKIEWWKWYSGVFGGQLDNNPSPGNKEGGLTTIAEKSLGAVAKGGSKTLEAVLDYADSITQKGFVFMDSPGFDPPSVTGMVAGGANVVIFTTGRGSCYGCKPTPSIKVATNTPMFERMQEDMDLDAGRILTGHSVQEIGEELFELVLRVASGEKTKSEQLGIGDEEFVPWTIGPVL